MNGNGEIERLKSELAAMTHERDEWIVAYKKEKSEHQRAREFASDLYDQRTALCDQLDKAKSERDAAIRKSRTQPSATVADNLGKLIEAIRIIVKTDEPSTQLLGFLDASKHNTHVMEEVRASAVRQALARIEYGLPRKEPQKANTSSRHRDASPSDGQLDAEWDLSNDINWDGL